MGFVRMDMAGVLGSLDVCRGDVKWETNKDMLDYGLADTMEFDMERPDLLYL